MRAFQGALGLTPEDGLVSPDYAVLRVKDGVVGTWLAAAMRTDAFVSEMTRRVKGIGSASLGAARTPRINVSDLAEIRIDMPSWASQMLEVAEFDVQIARVDTLIAESERLVELARERRAALITAAVTGQIDVREMV
jgi:type I restriction enzyme, S subunit